MKVKCPRCGMKEEVINNKCPICDLPLDPSPSKPVNKNVYVTMILILLVIIACLAYLFWNNKSSSKVEKGTTANEAKAQNEINWSDMKNDELLFLNVSNMPRQKLIEYDSLLAAREKEVSITCRNKRNEIKRKSKLTKMVLDSQLFVDKTEIKASSLNSNEKADRISKAETVHFNALDNAMQKELEDIKATYKEEKDYITKIQDKRTEISSLLKK